MTSQRNRTLRLTEGEHDFYAGSVLKPEPGNSLSLESILNKTIQGDAFTVCPQLPPASVDLLIADPPYNLDKNYNGNLFSRMPDADYLDFTQRWLDAVLPALKPNASLYICCDWKSSILIHEALQKQAIIQNRITWQREKGRGAKSNWKNAMEDIWFATMGKEYYFNLDAVKSKRRVLAPYRSEGKPKDWIEEESGKFRLTHPSNFWDDISIPYWSMPENTEHPTQKPEKLIAKLILASSPPGAVILDPFAGSGTTAVTAKKLQRNFIAIEAEAEYCAIAQKRLAVADTDKSIQGYVNGVFWERNTLKWQKKERIN